MTMCRSLSAVAKVAPMFETASVVPESFVLSTLPPSRALKRLALAVVLAMLVIFFIASGPLARVQLPRVAAFVPAYTMAVVFSDMITAILLFSQFSIFRTRALLVISSGYLFTALMPIPWILMFPGVFVPDGFLIGGLQSRVFLWFFWHGGFPIFVVFYVLFKDAEPGKRYWRGTTTAAIALSVALTATVVAALGLFFALEDSILPRVQLDPLRLSPLWLYLAVPTVSLIMLALFMLWIRRRSILDLWLMVVMCASTLEIWLSYFPDATVYRFGWYISRIFGLLSASLVLLVLLLETTTLYGRLLGAVLAQRREREVRLVTGDAIAANIAHEVNQPLSGMIASAEGGVRWLDRSAPDLDQATLAFKHIIVAGHRAAEVIASVRANFKRDARNRVSLSVNELIEEALALTSRDLQSQRIVVRAEPNEKVPQVLGDRILLQQVLVNLINNAIDSMAGEDEPRILHLRSEVDDDKSVIVSVADTGSGIDSEDGGRIFAPLFTTKSEGMGMGLAICRAIIEAHDGKLWYSPNTPRGAVFRFKLARS
jgi:signal transduction histidine kinase